MVDAGEVAAADRPALQAALTGRVWQALTRVWATGLTVVTGPLTLDATLHGSTVELLTVDFDGRTGTTQVTH